jgi:acetyl-CoA acyltransferase
MELNSIIGTGITPFNRSDRSIEEMAFVAVRDALCDAGVTKDQIDVVVASNAVAGLITGQEMIRGQSVLRRTGLLGKPVINTENACASGATAIFIADNLLRSGSFETALVLGVEKMTHSDKSITLGAIESAVDIEAPPAIAKATSGVSRSYFMDIYAHMARKYMSDFHVTRDIFAQVVVKNRRNGAMNKIAQFQSRVTVEEVLESRNIVEPLTLMMCSPITNGAAALVLSSPSALKRISNKPSPRPVWLASCALVSGRDDEGTGQSAVTRAAIIAYERASISPSDINVVELHDGAAPAELITTEQLLLAEPGEAVHLLEVDTK